MEGLKNVFRDIYKDKPLFWTLLIIGGVVLFVVVHNMAQSNATSVPGVPPVTSVQSGGSSGGSGGKKHRHGKKNGGGGGYGAGPVVPAAYDGGVPSGLLYTRGLDAGVYGPMYSS